MKFVALFYIPSIAHPTDGIHTWLIVLQYLVNLIEGIDPSCRNKRENLYLKAWSSHPVQDPRTWTSVWAQLQMIWWTPSHCWQFACPKPFHPSVRWSFESPGPQSSQNRTHHEFKVSLLQQYVAINVYKYCLYLVSIINGICKCELFSIPYTNGINGYLSMLASVQACPSPMWSAIPSILFKSLQVT